MIVETDLWDTRFVAPAREGPRRVVRGDRRTDRRDEDQAGVRPRDRAVAPLGIHPGQVTRSTVTHTREAELIGVNARSGWQERNRFSSQCRPCRTCSIAPSRSTSCERSSRRSLRRRPSRRGGTNAADSRSCRVDGSRVPLDCDSARESERAGVDSRTSWRRCGRSGRRAWRPRGRPAGWTYRTDRSLSPAHRHSSSRWMTSLAVGAASRRLIRGTMCRSMFVR